VLATLSGFVIGNVPLQLGQIVRQLGERLRVRTRSVLVDVDADPQMITLFYEGIQTNISEPDPHGAGHLALTASLERRM
jgi:hypothetical protein